MASSLNICDLPTETLIHIFKFLDLDELVILCHTSDKFEEVISTHMRAILDPVPLVTNQADPTVLARSFRELDQYDRIIVSERWKRGLYEERSFNKGTKCPLQLTKNVLWCAERGRLFAYERTAHGFCPQNIEHDLGNFGCVVDHFVVTEDYVLASNKGGLHWIYDFGESSYYHRFATALNLSNDYDSLEAVDMCRNLLATATNRGWVCLSRLHSRFEDEARIHSERSITSVKLSQDASLLAVGMRKGVSTSIRLLDVSRNCLKNSPQVLHGCDADILQMKWQNNSILWSIANDGLVRRWDLRTGSTVQSFESTFGSKFCSFDCDFRNTVMAGTEMCGNIVLWDTRQRQCVKAFPLEYSRRTTQKSPVTSVQFDAEFVFASTVNNIHVLDCSR